jgi:hypothetical protein
VELDFGEERESLVFAPLEVFEADGLPWLLGEIQGGGTARVPLADALSARAVEAEKAEPQPGEAPGETELADFLTAFLQEYRLATEERDLARRVEAAQLLVLAADSGREGRPLEDPAEAGLARRLKLLTAQACLWEEALARVPENPLELRRCKAELLVIARMDTGWYGQRAQRRLDVLLSLEKGAGR